MCRSNHHIWPQRCQPADTTRRKDRRTHASWLQHGVNTTPNVTKQPPWNASSCPVVTNSEWARCRVNWELRIKLNSLLNRLQHQRPGVERPQIHFKWFTYNAEKNIMLSCLSLQGSSVLRAQTRSERRWRGSAPLTHLCPQPCHAKKLADPQSFT